MRSGDEEDVLVFISGGVRSGKSSLGEELAASLAGENRKVYLATSRHYDEEMIKRIEIHQQKRADKGFFTIDKSLALGDAAPLFKRKDTVLLDCLGTLLANEMFDRGERTEPEYIRDKIWSDLCLIKNKVLNFIVISNEVFGDGILYDQPVEDYIQTLGQLHIKLAQASDVAIECVYAGCQVHKGGTQINESLIKLRIGKMRFSEF